MSRNNLRHNIGRAALLCIVFVFALLSSTRFARGDQAELDALRAAQLLPNGVWLESLDLRNMSSGYGQAKAGKSIDGNPLKLKGVVYPHGVSTHANSTMTVDLKGESLKFLAMVGIDDETNDRGAVIFSVALDGRRVFDSGIMKGGDASKLVSLDLGGARRMTLSVNAVNNDTANAHANWAGAQIITDPDDNVLPVAVDSMARANPRKFPMLPPANPRPAIHGARVVGASPRRPFLFLIPATGKAPLSYAANNLPNGLVLDAKSGIISGRIKQAGTYKVELVVKNALGRANRVLDIVCGDNKLAQTPPMGWNAWNVFGETVTADKIREQADWLIKSGLAAHGYNTIIIDDTWQARRDKDGNIAPNRRFGDIKALADYVHSKGLKLGIFSSPNEETCSGFAGSAGYEEQDAATYASWGIDYLKYDWCASGRRDQTKAEVVRAAYAKMRTALDKTDRDIVYALTTYGFGNPWEWASSDDVRGNTWTTNSSILDKWEFIRDNGFNQPGLASKAGPGHWNDPGWLMLGKIGSSNPHFSRLKANEQVLQVSLWSLLAAPMIVSCDLRQLDPNAFYPVTTALLTNDEVIDISQDPLGKAATRVVQNGDIEIWARPLWDGTQAVGIFNKGGWPQDVRVEWSQLGMSGSQPARDVWQHSDLGVLPGVSVNVPRHGVVLLKVGKPDESSTRPSKLRP